MKRRLCCFLAMVMVLTSFVISVSATTADSFSGDFAEGDNILYSFNASNASDLAQLTTLSGANVMTTTFGGETFAYAPTPSTGGDALVVNPIKVELSDKDTTYLKVRYHAVSSGSKATYLYAHRSGARRANATILDSEFGTDGLISEDVTVPAVEVIYALNASDADRNLDVYSVYMRPVGSNGAWYQSKVNDSYSSNTSSTGFQVYHGLAISSAVLYRKQAPELEVLNTATTVSEMKNALSTYATQLGVDLSKLDAVTNDDAVYEALLDIVFTSKEAVVSAFNAAVDVQIAIEDSENEPETDAVDGIDYVVGDSVRASFEPGKQSDLDRVNKDAQNSEVGTTEWEIFTNEEGSFLHAKEGTIYLPMCPGFPEGENLYIKFRLRAMTNDSSQGGFHFYFANTHRLRNYLTEDGYKAADSGLTFNTTSPAMDNIYEITPSGAWTLYAKHAESDGDWIKVATGQTAAHTNLKYWSIHSSLAVGDIKVYTKQAAELAAVNGAKDIAAMQEVLTTYATAFGIDLSMLDSVENHDAVYSAMLNRVYTSVEEVAEAFRTAIAANTVIKFDADYVNGDIIRASFSPSKQSDLERVNHDTQGAEVDSVEWETFTNEEGSFLHAKEGTIYLPMCPGFPEGENLYIKFRLRAMTNDSSQGGFHFYFANTHRLRNYLTEDGYKAADSSLTFNTTSPAMDNIYEITPSGAWTLYAKHAESDGDWIKVATGQTAAHTNLKYWSLHSSLAVGDILVYTKQPDELFAVNNAKDVDAMRDAITTYATELGIDLSKLDDVTNDDAVYEALLGTIYATPGEVLASFDSAVMVQKAKENVLTNPVDIRAQKDNIYLRESFDSMSSQISVASNVTISGGYAVFQDAGDLYLPVTGGMKGKMMRLIFKPNREATGISIMLYDVWGGANIPNRYYLSLKNLSVAWHEVVAFADGDNFYVWYRNMDENGAWKAAEVSSKSFQSIGYSGIRFVASDITIDELVAYNDMGSDYTVKESNNTVELDGKLFYGTPGYGISRNAQFVFTTYNKQYDYISSVDITEKVVRPAKEERIQKSYTYNSNADNYSVMYWDSIDTGIVLGEVYGYKMSNELGDGEESNLGIGEFSFERHLNDVIISGNVGENYTSLPVTIRIISDETGAVVAATQTTTNLKSAFKVSVGIDAGQLNSGNYTFKVTCGDVTATGSGLLCGTDLNYNGITSAEDLVTATQDYVSPEIITFFNQPNDTMAFDKFLKIKNGNTFSNIFEFKSAIDEAVSYTIGVRKLLDELNRAVVAERWSDVMNLIKNEYRELLGLPANPAYGIRNEMELFRRMIKDTSGNVIIYSTAEEVVQQFNAAVVAQKTAEMSGGNVAGQGGGVVGGGAGGFSGGGTAGGGGFSGGSGGGYGFDKEVIDGNKISTEEIQTMISDAKHHQFCDLSTVPWAEESIQMLYYKEIVVGDGNGYFYPGNNVKREEFLKMILLAAGISGDENDDMNFQDVDRNMWYFPYINAAYKNGIINGISDSQFGVGENITRADMVVIIKRILDQCNIELESIRPAIVFEDYDKIPSYAGTSITTLYMAGLVEGVGNDMFAPDSTATKAEAAVAINRVLNLLNN